MIEIEQGTATHTVSNPAQPIIIGVVVLLVVVGIALGLGYLFSKAQ